MRPLKAPKHAMEEDEIVQELAELDARLERTGQPTNTFEVRRRSFYEALARMWRQQLVLLQTGDEIEQAPIEPESEPREGPEPHAEQLPAEQLSEADRRRTPRLETEFDAEIIAPDDTGVPARVLNISRGGVALSFSRDTLRTVFPDNQVLPGSVVSIRFQDRDDQSPSPAVGATGVVVWVQQIHEDEYRLGLRWG